MLDGLAKADVCALNPEKPPLEGAGATADVRAGCPKAGLPKPAPASGAGCPNAGANDGGAPNEGALPKAGGETKLAPPKVVAPPKEVGLAAAPNGGPVAGAG